MIEVGLLGTGGMIPMPHRFLSSFICRSNGRAVIIDCGEGTQVSLQLLGWGFKNIDAICITHFHGDHISGLPGLLLAIGNSGRVDPLYIIGCNGLSHVVKSLCVIAPELPFELIFIEENYFTQHEFFNVNNLFVRALRVMHNVPCLAFSINLKRKGKFNVVAAKNFNIPINLWAQLQNGDNVNHNNKMYSPDMVMGDERHGIKISFCTDSRPTNALTNFVSNSNLFICEGIYGEDSKINKAIVNKHMVFSEAATIAKNANVKELWLTHYSPSLGNPNDFIHVARDIFPNTITGTDRLTKIISFDD